MAIIDMVNTADQRQPPDWIAIVSYNDKGDGGGFWQGDLFQGDADNPEAYFTLPREGTCAQAADRAHEKWPDAVIYIEDACIECEGRGVIYDDDEETCPMCGGGGTYLTVWYGR